MNFRPIAKIAIISIGTWQLATAQSGKETNMPRSCGDAIHLRQYDENGPQMSQHESAHAIPQSQKQRRKSARATAKIAVQNSDAKPYDQSATPPLIEIRLNEIFTGDINGESPVRALQVQR